MNNKKINYITLKGDYKAKEEFIEPWEFLWVNVS
jgi:hypothetical protein